MQEIALASLVTATPFAGVLLFIARRFDRDRTSSVATGLMSCAGLLVLATIVCLVLAAADGSRRRGDLPTTLLIVAAAGLFIALFFFVRYVLHRRRRIAVFRNQVDNDPTLARSIDDPALRLFSWCFLLSPLAFIAGFPALGLMMLFYAFHLWLRWRRQKQAGLLSILNGVAGLERPLGDIFQIGRSASWGWRRRLNNFAYNTQSGMPLSDAADPAGVISPRDVTLLRAAELAEAVERELPRLAGDSTTRARKSWHPNGMLAVCLYLQLLATAYFLVISFLMYWIVPKFKTIFEDFNVELPSVTVFLIRCADEVVNAFPFWISALACWLAAILGTAFIGVAGTGSMPGWLLEFGPRRWSSPTVFRALAMFLESGGALAEPLKELGRRSKNAFWWQRWIEVGGLIETCPRPAEALKRNGDLDDKRVAGMTAAAMTGSNAGPAQASFLRAIATADENLTKRRFTTGAGWLSAALFLLMSIVAVITTTGFFLCIVKLINELA